MKMERAFVQSSPNGLIDQRAAQYFRENLTDIINVAKKNHIGILTGTLASNLKDQEPFHSLFLPDAAPEAKARWEKFFQEGMELAIG